MKNEKFLKIGFIGSDRQSVLEDLKFAAENKFGYYEIQGTGTNFDLVPEIVREIRKISKKSNISLRLHIPYFLPISSSIPEISKAALKFAKKEILLAKRVGAKWITIHSGHLDSPWRKEIIIKQAEILIENLKELVNFAKRYGIEINLENSWKEAACVKANEILKVVKSAPGLKIVFDIGHANAANLDPIEYFKKIRKCVSAIHIHDNDGKSDQHALIGEGNINFKEFLRECKNSNYYGPFILELFPHKNILKGKEIFLNLWNQI